MKKRKMLCLFLLLSAAAAPLWAAGIDVQNAWVREAPPGAKVMAGYMDLRNSSSQPQRLTAVQSPQFAHVEMHRSEMHDGMAHMMAMPDIAVDAGSTVQLAPGGLHLMLMEPRQPLPAGSQVELTLEFADGSRETLQVDVRAADAMQGMHDHSGHQH